LRRGGDCEAIEQYVSHSFRNAAAKVQNFSQSEAKRRKYIKFLWISLAK
jgi:hypothetical protein